MRRPWSCPPPRSSYKASRLLRKHVVELQRVLLSKVPCQPWQCPHLHRPPLQCPHLQRRPYSAMTCRPALAVPSPAEAKSSAGDQEVTLTAEAMQSARENYAYQHELDISAVTDEMIYQTGEPAKWATSHLDMSARGPLLRP